MHRPAILWIALLALLLTGAYCVAATYLSLFWSVFVTDHEQISRFSRWTIVPISSSVDLAMAHWHALAFASLIGHAVWGGRRLRSHRELGALALPLSCHLVWLVTATLLHIGGGLISVVAVSYSLS